MLLSALLDFPKTFEIRKDLTEPSRHILCLLLAAGGTHFSVLVAALLELLFGIRAEKSLQIRARTVSKLKPE